ncbi:MAG: hypothetical protein ACRDD8_11710 [Bacteroidales bacterium]
MKEEVKNKLINFIVGDTDNMACMVYDSLEDELEDFVEYIKEDNMGESVSESHILNSSEETIAKMYREKVKDTAIHELTELYVKIEMLAKSLGYDMKSQVKAYMYYRKHDKK